MAAHRVLSLVALLVAPTTALSYDPARSLAPLHRLLLQRTVQTQTVYLTDFHDEAKAQWLANYLDPQAPMDTVRMSNTECLPRYNGLDGFPHATNEEYLRTMIRSEPITYEVRYKVGTWAGGNQGTGGAVGPSEEPAADEAFRKGMEQKQTLDFWGGSNNAAAASTRRNNPFLGEHTAKYREYEETIVPSRFAQLLMTTQQQLAKEWRRDLCAIYDGSLILPRDPDADEAQAIAAEQSLSVHKSNCRGASHGLTPSTRRSETLRRTQSSRGPRAPGPRRSHPTASGRSAGAGSARRPGCTPRAARAAGCRPRAPRLF